MRVLAKIVRNQARNIANLILGRSVITPALGSMTLARSDLQLAEDLLKQPRDWNSREFLEEYQRAFAQFNESARAFAFMDGRVALNAVLYALELKPGDEIIVPGYTCVAVPNAVNFAGLRPVFADIELDTYGLDVAAVEARISTSTRAIVLHHLYGLICRDYEAILDLAQAKDLFVIEDCAHATGARFKGQRVGNYGHAAFYSSEQSKIFNTIRGGVAVANDDTLAARLGEFHAQVAEPPPEITERQLYNVILNYYLFRSAQKWWRGDLVELLYGRKRLSSISDDEKQGVQPEGYLRKMASPIARLGLNQISRLDELNAERRRTARQWDKWCEEHNYRKPLVVAESVPVFLRYPVMVEPERKSDTRWARKELGIELGVWFRSQLHPVQRQIAGCPNAEQAVLRCVNFPCLLAHE